MKNKLFTLAAALTLAAVIGSIYAAPALAAVIKAALIKNVDEKGRIPFQETVPMAATCPDVPLNKRLVVEHVSGQVVAAASVKFFGFRVGSPITRFNFVLMNEAFNPASGETLYTIDSPTLIYLNHGDVCTVQFGGGIPNSGTYLTFTGYLVDLTI